MLPTYDAREGDTFVIECYGGSPPRPSITAAEAIPFGHNVANDRTGRHIFASGRPALWTRGWVSMYTRKPSPHRGREVMAATVSVSAGSVKTENRQTRAQAGKISSPDR